MKKATLQIDGSWKIEDFTSEEETKYNADVVTDKALIDAELLDKDGIINWNKFNELVD